MEAHRCPSSLKQRVWFSPYLLAVALMPAFIQIDYSGCFYYGDSRLSELELIVEGENRITGFDSDQRSYDVVLPLGTAEARVRSVANDPEGRVWVFVLIDGERFTYLDDGHGGSDIVVPLSPGSSVLQVAVAPHGRATDFYEVAIEIGIDLCAGADCDDGNDCTADICDPADGSCTNDLLPEGTLCGVDGVCEAGACRERSWGTPVFIQSNAAPEWAPQPVVDTSGNATVVWVGVDGVDYGIWANRYTPGAGWGTPELIATGIDQVRVPRLAVEPNGNVIVVGHQYDGSEFRIWANRYTPGAGWGMPEFVASSTGGNIYNPRVAVDPSGNAIVMWLQHDGVDYGIWANRYTPGAGWGTPELIAVDVDNWFQLAVDPNGNAIVMWDQYDGVDWGTWANRYTPGAGWGTPVPIQSNGYAGGAMLAVDPNGNAIAMWHQYDGSKHHIWANRYTPATGWGTPVSIQSNESDATHPQIGVDRNGNAIVVWLQHDEPEHHIWANRYTPATGWGTPVPIQSNDTGAVLAVDPNGNAIAMWHQYDGSKHHIWANRYTPATGWGTSEEIDTDPLGSSEWKLAIGPNGNAVAVWAKHIPFIGIQANHFE